MPAPTPSRLDYEQCIQGAYDEAAGRLRVETELATVNIGGSQEILITDDIDAIKIGDGNHNYLAVNSDGSINVNVSTTPTADTSFTNFNSITSVASGISTTLLTYTVPSTKNAYLQRAEISGTNIASYDFFIDGILNGRKRTYFGGDLDITFDFSCNTTRGLKINSNSTIQFKVLHNRPYLGDFEARLQLILAS